MTARVSVNIRPLPVCNDCGNPVKRVKSIAEHLCCCSRGTCNEPEPYGCIVCGAFLIERTDEVLGMCVRCSVVVA